MQAQIDNLQEQLQAQTDNLQEQLHTDRQPTRTIASTDRQPTRTIAKSYKRSQQDRNAYSKEIRNHQNNAFPAQIISKGLNPDMEDVFEYISNAMLTLKEFEKRYRSQAVTNLTPTRQ